MMLPACWWHGRILGRPGGGGGRNKGVIVITGASSGIGSALTLRMSRIGWRVVACDIDVARLVQYKDMENIDFVHLDVRSESSVRMLAKVVDEKFPGGIDALANVAGINIPSPLLETNCKTILNTLSTNSIGPLRTTKALFPALLRGEKSATVLNVSSTCGVDSWPWQGAYSMSKSALEAATDSIRREVLASGIPLNVILIQPGPVDTPMARRAPKKAIAWCAENPRSKFSSAMRRSAERARDAMRKYGLSPSSYRLGYTSDEVASVCLYALSQKSPRARYLAVRGPFLLLLWLARVLPSSAGDWIMSRV